MASIIEIEGAAYPESPGAGSRPRRGAPGAVAWGAILAGAGAAIAVTMILFVLGTGLGLSAISPWSGAGASAATVGVSAVIWLVVVQWISSGIGGLLAGRLRTRWEDVHVHEIFFRDTAHGFLAWAIASLAGVLVVASITLSGLGAAARDTSLMASGATRAAGMPGGMGYYVDSMFRPANPGTATTGGNPQAETTRILAASTHDGQVQLSPEDRGYLAQMIATRSGLDQGAAQARVDAIVGQIDAARQKARQIADQARKRTAQLAIVTALSMLVGAFIASVAGALGGSLRYDHRLPKARREP